MLLSFQVFSASFGATLIHKRCPFSVSRLDLSWIYFSPKGVKVDQNIHAEVLERSKQFNSAPYGGFINPKYSLVKNKENGEITDVLIEYPNDFTTQMMGYAKNYSFLPHLN